MSSAKVFYACVVLSAIALMVVSANPLGAQTYSYSSLSDQPQDQAQPHLNAYGPYAYGHYVYKYGVNDPHTGDVKSASEWKQGDLVTGEYSLLQPDGSTRLVKYTADKLSGFHAVVGVVY